MDLKFKAGYDSEVRLGWASLWVRLPFLEQHAYVASNFKIFNNI